MINGSAAGSLPAAAGISAMNAINVDIVRSLFMPLFLGGTLAAAALAQRVEVVDPSEIRIMGSKTELLRTLAAAASVESAAVGVRSFIPKWRPDVDETENYVSAGTL